jgi:Ran GTPase-activating protein (RanGAP) involved in mRNA processing and transport
LQQVQETLVLLAGVVRSRGLVGRGKAATLLTEAITTGVALFGHGHPSVRRAGEMLTEVTSEADRWRDDDTRARIEALHQAGPVWGGRAGEAGSLDLRGRGLGPTGARMLGEVLQEGGPWPALEALLLSSNDLGDEGLEAWAWRLGRTEAPALPHVTRLDLGRNALTHDAALILTGAARQALLPGLRTLGLGHNPLGARGIASLAPALETLPYLTELDVGYCEARGGGGEGPAAIGPLEAFCRLGACPALERLRMCGLGDLAWAWAGGLAAFPRLKCLDLSGNTISGGGAVALLALMVHPGAFPVLEELSLSSTGLGVVGAAEVGWALRQREAFPGLRVLKLRDNGMGDDGAEVLARALQRPGVLTSLTALDLASNEIHAEGATAVIRSLRGRAPLASLSLTDNPCGPARYGLSAVGVLAEALAEPGGWPNLTSLSLTLCDLGDSEVEHLAVALSRGGGATRLAELSLGQNRVTDRGVEALVALIRQEPRATALREVTLAGNGDVSEAMLEKLRRALLDAQTTPATAAPRDTTPARDTSPAKASRAIHPIGKGSSQSQGRAAPAAGVELAARSRSCAPVCVVS